MAISSSINSQYCYSLRIYFFHPKYIYFSSFLIPLPSNTYFFPFTTSIRSYDNSNQNLFRNIRLTSPTYKLSDSRFLNNRHYLENSLVRSFPHTSSSSEVSFFHISSVVKRGIILLSSTHISA